MSMTTYKDKYKDISDDLYLTFFYYYLMLQVFSQISQTHPFCSMAFAIIIIIVYNTSGLLQEGYHHLIFGGLLWGGGGMFLILLNTI